MAPAIERKCTQILETVLNGNYLQTINEELECQNPIDLEDLHREKEKLSSHLAEEYKGECKDNAEERRIARVLSAILKENRAYKCRLDIECFRDCFNHLRHINDARKAIALISDTHDMDLATLKKYLRYKQEALSKWLLYLSQKDLTEETDISPLFPPLRVEEILQSAGHLEKRLLRGKGKRWDEVKSDSAQ